MSEANVEIVRRVYEAVARRDAEAVFALYDPDVEFDFSRGPLATVMGGDVYRGHEGLRRWSRDRHQVWERVEDECEELIAAGDHVISVVTTRGRGRASGAEVAWTHHAVWTIREGKVVRAVWFRSRAEALEEATRLGE